MSNAPIRIKRSYETVTIETAGNSYVVTLDGRKAKTQTRKPLTTPTMALAQAIADEWSAQQEFIDRQSMPLTALLTAVIDGGAVEAVRWRQDILDYLGSDLICYRAQAPQKLVQRQSAAWDPYLEFMQSEFDVGLVTTAGIMAIFQPAGVAEKVHRVLDGQSNESLFALRTATAITGSAVLALALWKNYREASIIFDASRIDEQFQEESWGADDEARIREDNIRNEFLAIGQFLALI